jgi:hypothetical protein
MSAVNFNDFKPASYRNEQSRILAERTQMLINISKKAREESLTLQETNDLYAEFNKAYDLSNIPNAGPQKVESKIESKIESADSSEELIHSTRTEKALKAASEMIAAGVIKIAEPLKTVGLDGVDESWAIKLLKECELDEEKVNDYSNQSSYRQMIQPVLCEA